MGAPTGKPPKGKPAPKTKVRKLEKRGVKAKQTLAAHGTLLLAKISVGFILALGLTAPKRRDVDVPMMLNRMTGKMLRRWI
jgi:hypothetical protein